MQVHTDNADELWQRALAAGAEVHHDLALRNRQDRRS
jgi:hypothetical protein